MEPFHNDNIFYQFFNEQLMQKEDISIMDIKRNTLNEMLKKGSEHYLDKNYEQAIPLYECAVKLLNEDPCAEEYDLNENDQCAIEYCLCMSYITQEKHYDKASEDFSPLVISYGKQFPTLYYAQAKLYFQQKLYAKTEKCISDGLEALLNIPVKGIFKTNYPGTDVQIPESDTDFLRKCFKNLKKNCLKPQTTTFLDYLNVATGTNSTSNAKIVSASKRPKSIKETTNSNEITLAGTEETNLATPTDLQLSGKCENIEKPNLDGDEVLADTDMLNNQKEPSTDCSINVEKSILKVDVPEFFPKSFLLNSSKETTSCVCSQHVQTDLSFANGIFSGVVKYTQTTHVKTLEKNTQVQAKTSNYSTQTLKREKESCQRCSLTEKEAANSLKRFEVENKILQKKVKDLTEKLDASKKQVDEEQQNRKELEQKMNIDTIKFEMQLSDVTKSLDNEIKNLSSAFMVHCIKNNDIQKLFLNKHVERCKSAISSLSHVMRFLTSASIPTLKDAKHHIDLWKMELERTLCCLNAFQKYQQEVLTEFKTGNFSTLPEPPEFFCNIEEPINILQECFHLAIGNLISELRHLQAIKKYHDDYYHWWNVHGKFMYHQTAPPVVGQPIVGQQPLVGHPAVKPVGAQPVVAQPVVAQPVLAQPVLAQPILAQPVVAQPVNGPPAPHQQFLYPPFEGPQGQPQNLPNNQPKWVNKYGAPTRYESPVTNNLYHNNTHETQASSNSHLLQVSDVQTNLLDMPIPITESQLYDAKSTKLNVDIQDIGAATEISLSVASQKSNFLDELESLEKESIKSNDVISDDELHLESDQLAAGILEPEYEIKPLKFKVKSIQQLLNNSDVVSQLDDDCLESPDALEESVDTAESAVVNTKIAIVEHVSETVHQSEMHTRVKNKDICDSSDNMLLCDNSQEKQDSDFKHIHSGWWLSSSKDDDSLAKSVTTNGITVKKPSTTIPVIPKPLLANNDLINLNHIMKKEDEVAQSGSSLKALGGPKFYSLFCYVKSKIPHMSENDVWIALSAVKQQRIRLSGMTKDSIVAAVQTELITSMELNEKNANKVAWAKVNNEPAKWNKDQQDTSCVICIEPFERMPVTSLKCEHKFHTECIKKWFSTNCVCPVCRIHATTDEDFPPLRS